MDFNSLRGPLNVLFAFAIIGFVSTVGAVLWVIFR